MDSHSKPRPPGPLKRHLDGIPRPQTPESCRRAVTQHSSSAGRKHSSHSASVRAEDRVPHGVHAAMQNVESAVGESVVGRATRNTRFQEIPSRNNAVLVLRVGGDQAINGTTLRLATYSGAN
jgi:hypothetical protein